MKRIILWLFFGSVPLCGITQKIVSLEESFYNLPINSSRKIIRSQLITDPRFKESGKLDTSFLGFNNYSFLGNIVQINLPSTFKVDSATIELTWGYGMLTKSKSKGRHLTFIKLEYFVPDSLSSSNLANLLWDRHKKITSDTFDVTVGRKEDNNYSYGKRLKISRRKYLPIFSVLQQKYSDGVFAIRIEYERYDN